jgi:general secretion pathway protein A
MKDQRVFSSELLEEINRRSRGIPRLINLICDNLLVTAFAMETRLATLEMLDEVTTDLRIEWPGANRGRGRSRYSMTEDATPEQTLPIARD